MNSNMRTVRWAEEVQTQGGFVDVIRFEDYIKNNKSFCKKEQEQQSCKLENKKFPGKHCHGCVCHAHVYELDILTTCYEVKISKSDFKSKNGHNFYGNRNYYVVPVELYNDIIDMVPQDIGVIVYYSQSQHMKIKKEAIFREVSEKEVLYLMYNSLKKWVDKIGYKYDDMD